METLFWSIILILSLINFLLTIYFYLAHDDLKRGKLSPYELTESLKSMIPWEVAIHAIVILGIFFIYF